MNIRELSLAEFKTFADNHPLGNFHQTLEYALLKAEDGYEYEMVGYTEGENILAASLILYKKVKGMYYGYAPRGFLIDYKNKYFLRTFTEQLTSYYNDKGFIFIKINPEVAIGKINIKNKTILYNENYPVIDNLLDTGYTKLKNNMHFESILPRVNAIIPLNEFNYYKLSKNTKNKLRKGIRKGLTIEKRNFDKINILYDFIKNKRDNSVYYYNDLCNVFSKNKEVDLFLVKIDYKKYLINSQKMYEYELSNNALLNEQIINSATKKSINKKMNSDKALLAYKNDISEASKYLNTDIDTYVAGALVIKHNNRITIEISGYDTKYKRFAPNYFLYYAILDYYKGKHKYADLNGVTADLSHDNPYYGLNKFKFGFNPDIYEYIGEFDLVIDEDGYKYMMDTGLLAKEFNK